MMFILSSVCLPLLASAFGVLAGSQTPLQLAHESPWDRAPHRDATGNLVFTTASSLLQTWPNTVVRPGHTMVPVVMPEGTIMYHGRRTDRVPEVPEWLAFDFEHAYFFASANSSAGYVLTFVAKRPIKLIYLDGSSAVKLADGSLDSQDVLIHREVKRDQGFPFEKAHIKWLCAWGKTLGLDGFVRMAYHFEVMYCDFSDDGFALIDTVDVIPGSGPFPSAIRPPDAPRRRSVPPVPGWIGSLPTKSFTHALVAGKWHDYAPGETRVRVDYSGLVSFYDPALTSLVEARRDLPRAQHRLLNISRTDADLKVRELEEVITREPWGGNSGVDWASIMRIVIERYGSRLELLNNTLAADCDSYNITQKASVVRQQLLAMLLPYVTRQDVSARLDNLLSNAWLAPVVRRCSTTQTGTLPVALFTKQELLIHNAVQETLYEICRRLARAFALAFDIETRPVADAQSALAQIEEETHSLMSWLDWTAVWVKCRPACAWDEMCRVPTWPFRKDESESDTTPRCVRLPDV